MRSKRSQSAPPKNTIIAGGLRHPRQSDFKRMRTIRRYGPVPTCTVDMGIFAVWLQGRTTRVALPPDMRPDKTQHTKPLRWAETRGGS